MFVYTITNTVNGRVYVGKSCMPAKRWSQHKADSLAGEAPLYRSMRKHGVDAFEFAVVEECVSEAESYEAEKRWIVRLDSTVGRNGYNRTGGGNGTCSPSAETVAKRVAKLRGQKRGAEQRKNLAQSDHRYRHITPAACWELYSQGLSCRDVAERLGVDSEQPIRRFLRLGGYQLRASGREKRAAITAESCWQLYSAGLSLDAVAERFGCNRQLVFRRLKGAGHTLRDAVQSHLRVVGKGQ